MYAAKGRHVEVCELLLDRGAQVDAKNNDGRTALYWAIHYSYEGVCRLLLDRGFILPQVDPKEVNEFLKKCVSLFLSFKRLTKEHNLKIPKDIRYLILKTWMEEEDKINKEDTLPKLEMLIVHRIRIGYTHLTPPYFQGRKNKIIESITAKTLKTRTQMIKDVLPGSTIADIHSYLNDSGDIKKKLDIFSKRRKELDPREDYKRPLILRLPAFNKYKSKETE